MTDSSSTRRGPLVVTILKGQVISALIAGTGFFASLLSSNGISIPLLLSTVNYALLVPYIFLRGWLGNQLPCRMCSDGSKASCSLLPSRHGARSDTGNDSDQQLILPPLSCPWWVYAILALIDLEANVIIVSAYRYTSVTSVMLLDCFSIPCVMMLSYLFLKAKYTRVHLLGVVICLFGMGCIILSDYLSGGGSCSDCSNPFYGDMLCLIGTSLYAVSNVAQEKLVKHNNREEYLGMLGSFGTLFGTIQLLIMETGPVSRVEWTYETVGFIVGFVVCLNVMYTRASQFLKDCDAALLNLSLLTSDVYAVVFAYLCYGYLVSWLYFLAFGLACTGLAIYSTATPPTGITAPNDYGGNMFKDGEQLHAEDEAGLAVAAPFQASYFSVPPGDDDDSSEYQAI